MSAIAIRKSGGGQPVSTGAARNVQEAANRIIFLLTPNSWLGGETPLARLRRDEVQVVIDAANRYGEQAGASTLQAAADCVRGG